MLQRTVSSELLALLCPKAKRRLKDNLQRILTRATRPCFELELKAFRCAFEAIYSEKGAATTELIERKFLEKPPHGRLVSLFKNFPVLAKLWSQLISQWCDHIVELLLRFKADRHALSHTFFGGQRLGKIIDLRGGLSDPHNRGRTVVLLKFESGSVIYKPRRGEGEWEWLSLLQWMNSHSFHPKLRAARVLRREGYCWMENIQPGPCKDRAAARRFYRRTGGMLGAAYLLKAVDCHRDNVIASGEYPVLIDAETLWHVTGETKTQSLIDALSETGFLSSSGRRSSWQYRSSALGRTSPGQHTPRIASTPLNASTYEVEIVDGFRRAWRCLLGTTERRAAFVRRLQRLRRLKRRQIYWPTRNYEAIRRASVQPAALRTGIERDLLIGRLCARSAVPQTVVREEINALKRLDIPYFIRKTTAGPALPEDNATPIEIVEGLRHALHL